MFKQIRIQNFRSVKDVVAKNFGEINLVTGANGVGKSTLLEAVFLSAGGTNASLVATLNVLRGDDQVSTKNDIIFHSLFHKLETRKSIQINSIFEAPNTQLMSRELKITPILRQKLAAGETGVDVFVNGLNFEFEHKRVRAKKSKLHKGRVSFDDEEHGKPLSFSKVDQSILVEARYISPMASSFRDVTDRVSSVIRSKEIDQVIDLLRIVDPRITDVTTLAEGGRTQVYVDIGMSTLLPITYMGGGFIRILNYAVTMITDPVILIDEIENGLHYSMHSPILAFLFQAATRLNRQVFMTTHSAEFLDRFVEAMNKFEENSVKAYRCLNVDGDLQVNEYTEEELGLREQLDIELR